MATWVTAAGWTRALEKKIGRARVLTPAGMLTAAEAEALVAGHRKNDGRPSMGRRIWGAVRGLVREELHTARKDMRDLMRATKYFRHTLRSVQGLRLVWQHHELFQGAGNVLARRADVPLIQFVDAPVVWEAGRWGVRRPWGRMLERVGEAPQLRWADLVACVSDEVRSASVRLGARPERTIVTPCAVDAENFVVSVERRTSLRTQLGIRGDETVVGWVGSFRNFHGLELLLEAATQEGVNGRITLLLVGDGQERRAMEQYCRHKGITKVIFTGLVPHLEVRDYIGAFDVAVVTAAASTAFHYSPLKLKEYMAAQRPVIAPAVGEIPSLVTNEEEGILTLPGDTSAIAEAIRFFVAHPERGRLMGEAARKKILMIGTWDEQVRIAIDALRAFGWRL